MNKIITLDEKLISKINMPIVLLDMGTNGMYALNKIKQALEYENIVYINDLENKNYEKTESDLPVDVGLIEMRIASLIERVKKYNPKLIIVCNDTLIEYGKVMLDDLSVPKIYINEVIIEEVNKNYEFKNMAFFATQGIIEANLYQHNFHYTRLYNLNADNIMEALENFQMKTSASFSQVKFALFPLYKKEVDVIIPTLPNILLFTTEIFEYVKEQNKDISIIQVDELLANKAKEMLQGTNSKEKAKKYIYIVDKNESSEKDTRSAKKALKVKEKDKRKLYDKVLNVKYKFIYE